VALSKSKGDLAEVVIMADLMKRGHKIALPYGEDWPFDLVVMRAGRFERVQCKTGRLRDGAVVFDCSSTRKYTSADVDWMAAYEPSTQQIYYVPAGLLGNGMNTFSLRVEPLRSQRTTGIHFAHEFQTF
jgi:hypothetical protein